MIKQLAALLLTCIVPSLAFGGVAGTRDTRVVIGYVGEQRDWVKKLPPDKKKNIWNTRPYNNIVCLNKFSDSDYKSRWYDRCGGTGQFISPRHILTNAHVVNGRHSLTVDTSDGKQLKANLVFCNGVKADKNTNCHNVRGMDVAILEVDQQNFCSSHYFGYVSPTSLSGGMWRAGFGSLRVMTDAEFDNVRKAYNSAISKWWIPNDEFDKVGLEIDYDNLANSMLTTFQEKFAELTGEDFVNEYLFEGGTLTLNPNCSIIERRRSTEARHSCHSWPGDSGSSIQNKSNQVVLLNEGVFFDRVIGGKRHDNRGLRTENIFSKTVIDALNTAKENCKSSPQPKPTPKPQPGPEPTPSDERAIGGECLVSDLPPHASAGHYIKSGRQKYDCGTDGVCSCGATQCESGYYLVVNASGNSQGWCYTRRCPSGKHLNIIDGYKTDTKCVDKV